MSIVLGLIPLLLMTLLYSWYLRVSARITRQTSPSWKLCITFVLLILLGSFLVRLLLPAGASMFAVAAGVFLHLIFGAVYFGRFATNGNRTPLGFVGGLKLTALAMTFLLVTIGVLFGIVRLLGPGSVAP